MTENPLDHAESMFVEGMADSPGWGTLFHELEVSGLDVDPSVVVSRAFSVGQLPSTTELGYEYFYAAKMLADCEFIGDPEEKQRTVDSWRDTLKFLIDRRTDENEIGALQRGIGLIDRMFPQVDQQEIG